MIPHVVLLANQFVKEENISKVPHFFDHCFQNQLTYPIA
jgi:hypothetical protein